MSDDSSDDSDSRMSVEESMNVSIINVSSFSDEKLHSLYDILRERIKYWESIKKMVEGYYEYMDVDDRLDKDMHVIQGELIGGMSAVSEDMIDVAESNIDKLGGELTRVREEIKSREL